MRARTLDYSAVFFARFSAVSTQCPPFLLTFLVLVLRTLGLGLRKNVRALLLPFHHS